VLIIGVLVLVCMFIPVGVVVAMSATPPAATCTNLARLQEQLDSSCEPYGMCEAFWRCGDRRTGDGLRYLWVR
jgi:hypothetical protein